MSIFGIGLLLFQIQLGSASGIVNKPASNEPLPGATVVLTPVLSTQTARTRFTISEDDGRFALRDIEPGEYRLQAQSPLYGGVSYGQRRPGGPGAILTIAAGKSISDIRVSMVPTGAIAGRITGRNGEPLAYATVQALKYVYQEGKRILAPAQITTTDDRGDYRLFWLTSGKYVVVAAPRNSAANIVQSRSPVRPGDATRTTGDLLLGSGPPALNPQFDTALDGTSLVKRILEDGTIQEESWMPTFYPATADRALATPVDVTVGSTVPGINISLSPSRVQKIRGRVTGFTSMTTVGLATVSQGTIGRLINKGVSLVDGSFEFPGVVPGPYYLTAQDQSGLLAAPTAVLVADRDVENLSLPLAPGITVTAQITAEGALTGLAGTLRPDLDVSEGGLRLNFGLRSVPVSSGNVMVFSNVAPGNYQLNLQHLANPANPKRFYIKSIRQGREDAFGTVRLSADTKDVLLEVVLATETGAVEGVALGRTGEPAANVTVVLVPANARKRTNLYQTLVTGSDGKFRFQEIPPGDYKLFAWLDIETGAWQDDEFIRPYESRGRAVRVSENSKDDVQLNVIYNP